MSLIWCVRLWMWTESRKAYSEFTASQPSDGQLTNVREVSLEEDSLEKEQSAWRVHLVNIRISKTLHRGIFPPALYAFQLTR